MNSKVFFPNLDGMRFFAFFFVFMFHCYYAIPAQLKGNVYYEALHFLWANGDLGVNFFFTLSGFLITYLLLNEEQKQGSIHILHFYLRRVLRIWPLYYVTFLFGYFIFQSLVKAVGASITETANPWYYLIFAGNFNSIVNGAPVSGTLSVLWSIAIEEQFYLCWPLLLIAFRQNRGALFVAITAISLIFRMYYFDNEPVLFYHTLSVMSDLAIGSWLGWWCFNRKYKQNSLQLLSRLGTVLIYIIGFALILFRKEIFIYPPLIVAERLIFSIFFAFIIFEQSFCISSFYQMQDLKFASNWGKYTYGLYCLHIPAMVFTEGFAMIGGVYETTWWLLVGKTTSTFLLSLVFCRLSFRYVERPFLKLKESYDTGAKAS